MAVKINLAPVKRGDKWRGVPTIGPVLVNGIVPSFPLARVRAQFKRSGQLGMTLDSNGNGDHPIVIHTPETWFASIPPIQPLPLGAGSWEWDMEFYAEGDTAPETYYYGVLEVITDVTR